MSNQPSLTTAWICECGHENSITNRFCPRCGHGLPESVSKAVYEEEILLHKGIVLSAATSLRQNRLMSLNNILLKGKRALIPVYLAVAIALIGTNVYLSDAGTIQMTLEDYSDRFSDRFEDDFHTAAQHFSNTKRLVMIPKELSENTSGLSRELVGSTAARLNKFKADEKAAEKHIEQIIQKIEGVLNHDN